MKLSQIPRTTLAYLTAVALLGGVYVVQETRTPQRNTIPIPAITDELDRIIMEQEAGGDEESETGRLELYRESDGWRVRAGDAGDAGGSNQGARSYRADPAAVDALLRDLEALSAADVISTRADYEKYGLSGGDETRRLRLFVGDTQPLALEFGAPAAAGEAVYGRINGSREVVLLPRSLPSAVTTNPEGLRDTAVVHLPEERITQVEIRSSAHEMLTLSRERPGASNTAAAAEEGQPVWRIEPESVGEVIASGRVRDFFSEVNPLRAQEFLTDPPQGEPFAEIVIRRSGGRNPEEIQIWPPDEDRGYPVQVASADEAILVPEWRARRLLLGMERYFAPFATEAD